MAALPTNEDISCWQRVVIYEHDSRFDKTYRTGTIYGRSLAVLGRQVAGLLKKKWNLVDAKSLAVQKETHELRVSLTAYREVRLIFEIPGNENTRSLGQNFGTLQRHIKSALNSKNVSPTF